MTFDWDPDAARLADLLRRIPSYQERPATITLVPQTGWCWPWGRKIAGYEFKGDFDKLIQIELDFFFRPGNRNIRQWAYFELNVKNRRASFFVHGDRESFEPVFRLCVDRLGLRRTTADNLAEKVSTLKHVLDSKLFAHIEGALKSGQLTAALSAAVVYVEDRLRNKVGAAGAGLTGVDLAICAFKNPGLLIPPLSLANNAQDSAHLLVRGWIGLVRNLHGHQAAIPLTQEDACAQLLGVNYVLWIVENSKPKP
ncbi:MAG: TIGR02391 family protein [Opitutus sp.]